MAFTPVNFGATSVTSGLDADKPANPKSGNQYLATDTKKQYNCYVAGTWEDTTPPITAYGDIPMVAGSDVTLFHDPNVYSKTNLGNPNSNILKQYIVRDIKGFTDNKSFNVDIEFGKDSTGGITVWSIRVNGVIRVSDTFENNTDTWLAYTNLPISLKLKVGDVIQIYMARLNATADSRKTLSLKNFSIKCATLVFKPKVSLPLS